MRPISDDVYLEVDGSVASLVLNRPAKRNALTFDMWDRIPVLLAQFEQDPALRVLIVRGAGGRAFSAGADISEFETLRASSTQTQVYNATTARAQDMLAGLSKPTIALVQGVCVGGGCGVALSCDLRYSDGSGTFAITPAKLGIVYPVSVTKRLVDLVGPAHAKAILLTGMALDATRARELGLVNDVFAAETIDDDVRAVADTVATRAQYSVRTMKRIIELVAAGLTQENDETLALRSAAFDTADYREGVRAFMEKRPADFSNV
ncbi:MAG: enoyl-CoA hydratase [Nitriliruptorales bacterium]|nr:enoyl-CoA hydratase [Nitriliruptorales bacterium]